MARFLDLRVRHEAETFAFLVSETLAHMRSRGELKTQVADAANSVPNNIAEGAQRGTDREFLHFLRIADASLAEVHAQLRVADRCGLVSTAHAQRVIAQACNVGGMIDRIMARIDSDLQATAGIADVP